MVPRVPASKRGRISFPVLVVLLVIGTVAIIWTYRQQFPAEVPFTTDYVFQSSDIRGTQIKSSNNPQVDLIVYLSPTGSQRVASWIAAHPDTDVTIAYGDRPMGMVKLTPTMDTHTLHLVAPAGMALTARYAIGR